ncbi:hypothetical protein [Streptomyces sp. NPDC003077]|uniref:hypothetical protein n=1 Tax=Streptomyces sp. NPDC003077 TaxID=3154443 RepID=UPI0033AA7877
MPLQTAVDALADRLRALPQSALSRGAAAEGAALARELSERARRLESPERKPYELPDAGMFVVADQVAVTGHDLVEAVRSAPADVAARELAEAEALVREAARRI